MSELGPEDIPKGMMLEDFTSPVEAFDVVAGELLTEAAARGVLDFTGNDLGVRDAVDALNVVGKYIDEHPEELDWHERFELIMTAYDTDEHRNAFSFGMEAVLRDGMVKIWRPQ